MLESKEKMITPGEFKKMLGLPDNAVGIKVGVGVNASKVTWLEDPKLSPKKSKSTKTPKVPKDTKSTKETKEPVGAGKQAGGDSL